MDPHPPGWGEVLLQGEHLSHPLPPPRRGGRAQRGRALVQPQRASPGPARGGGEQPPRRGARAQPLTFHGFLPAQFSARL